MFVIRERLYAHPAEELPLLSCTGIYKKRYKTKLILPETQLN